MVVVECVTESDETGFRTRIDGTLASSLTRPIYGLVPLRASELTLIGGDTTHDWRCALRPDSGGWWVETTLTVYSAIELNPSMLLWLGQLDNLEERQAHTWRQTILRAPTTNQQGLGGNDLPACYLYDHARNIETICYFPADSFTWTPRRFYHFAAHEVFQYQPSARYGLGLVANAPESLFRFEPGEYTFRWWFTQNRRDDIPSAWAAQKSLLDALSPLLNPMPHGNAINWPDFAYKTLADLHDEACWTTAAGVSGLRAYVRGSSAVGRDQQRGFELMTQLDVLWPLLMWRDATGSLQADELIKRLLDTLPHFDRPGENFVANSFPPRPGDTFMDTWYFLENALVKLPWVAYLCDDEALKLMFRSALDGAQKLARNTGYMFPLFATADGWQPRGSVLNAGVAGLYAAGSVLAAQMFGDDSWLDEAQTALTAIHNLPLHMLTHEPQQLSFAAAAARMLAVCGRGDRWRHIAADFVRLSLRMGYWAGDPSIDYYDPRGMFQACASLSYPAFKENVETVLAWPELLGDDTGEMPAVLMAAFANMQRVHNRAFFDPYLPAELRRGPCAHIPYEDLATAEFPHTAKLGKELYGAGEVFWSALLFGDAPDDAPDVLVLSLDVPCLELRRLQSRKRRLLLYNPSGDSRAVPLPADGWERTVHVPPGAVTIIEGP